MSSPATIALEQFLENEHKQQCHFSSQLDEFDTTSMFQALENQALAFPTISWSDVSDSDESDNSCGSESKSMSVKKARRHSKFRSMKRSKSQRGLSGLVRSSSSLSSFWDTLPAHMKLNILRLAWNDDMCFPAPSFPYISVNSQLIEQNNFAIQYYVVLLLLAAASDTSSYSAFVYSQSLQCQWVARSRQQKWCGVDSVARLRGYGKRMACNEQSLAQVPMSAENRWVWWQNGIISCHFPTINSWRLRNMWSPIVAQVC